MHDTVSVTFDRSDGRTSYWYGGDRIWAPTGQKLYDYRAPAGLLAEGDQAVVDSPSGTTVVTVRRVNGAETYKGVKKWVVCKVDRTLAKRREQVAEDIAELEITIERTVENLVSLRRIEIACSMSPDLARSVELLGKLKAEQEELGA